MKRIFILISPIAIEEGKTYKQYRKELKAKFEAFYKQEVAISNDFEDEDNDILLYDFDTYNKAKIIYDTDAIEGNEMQPISKQYPKDKDLYSQYYEEFFIHENGIIKKG